MWGARDSRPVLPDAPIGGWVRLRGAHRDPARLISQLLRAFSQALAWPGRDKLTHQEHS